MRESRVERRCYSIRGAGQRWLATAADIGSSHLGSLSCLGHSSICRGHWLGSFNDAQHPDRDRRNHFMWSDSRHFVAGVQNVANKVRSRVRPRWSVERKVSAVHDPKRLCNLSVFLSAIALVRARIGRGNSRSANRGITMLQMEFVWS